MTFQTIIPKVGQEFKGIQEYWSMVENCTSLSVGPLIDFQLTAYYICTVFFEFPHTKKTINTVPYVHICASSTPVWWFVWRFCYVKNVLLFPMHLMCTRHSISERLRTYSWIQPGSVKIYFILQVLLYTFKCGLSLLTCSSGRVSSR